MSDPVKANIVFLHIPKTAGQTIHTALCNAVGPEAVSPIRVHTQVADGPSQFPPGYRLYSGHLDWEAIERVPKPRFVFTVLRDPLERLASFYFYIRRQAERISLDELAKPNRIGMRMALLHGPDEYFFGGNEKWREFVRDHYHSVYCSYLISRRIRGFFSISKMNTSERVDLALKASKNLDGIYSVETLDVLQQDLHRKLGIEVDLTGRTVNAGPEGQGGGRWDRLNEIIEKDETRQGILEFVRSDQLLLSRINFGFTI